MTLHSVCSWEESPERRYRYWLEAKLQSAAEEDSRICLFLMLNPNKADNNRSDETVDRCKSLAREWGCDTLWVCNLFPIRGGNSSVLPRDRMGPHEPERSGFEGCVLCSGDSHRGLHINDRHIMEAARKANRIVCAWGDNGGFDERSRKVVQKLVDAGYKTKLHIFGETRKGQPRHAKPQRRDQWPQAADLKQWADAQAWLDASRPRRRIAR